MASTNGKARPKIAKNANKTPKSKKISNTTFVLSGISAIKTVLSQYVKNKKEIEDFAENNENGLPLTRLSIEEDMPITDILHEKSKRVRYFLDSHKIQIKLWPNMIDVSSSNKGSLPPSTTRPCWWDRHSFQTRPIGCPLKFIPATQTDVEIYETEGYFCSFPCCKAYIISHKSEIKYKESLTLLTTMFMTFYKKIEHIPPSPTWKILKDYGGHLSIQEYRSSFGRLAFNETVNFKNALLLCRSQYVQENRSPILKKTRDQK